MAFSLLIKATVLSIIVLVTGLIPVASSATGLGNIVNTGVCSVVRSSLSSVTVYSRSYYTLSERYTTSCGFLWLSRCSRYRTRYVYYSVSSVSYYVSYYSTSVCCSGYQSVLGQCVAICNQGCTNGVCISPNVCSCYYGWTGSSCSTDINECNYNWCSHNCTNEPGYYTCSCPDNYYLGWDAHTCYDVNECTNGQVTTDPLNDTEMVASALPDKWCEQRCLNIPGSYSCDCFHGYELDDNNQTCSDVNECLIDNGGCNQTCNNTKGSFHCLCNPGYILLDDKASCADHCECCTGEDDCQQLCHNTAGSYYCSCKSGYRISKSNSSACEDIDECREGSDTCDQICTNKIGEGYSCACLSGFTLLSDNRTCQDINECARSNGGCAHHCSNANGTYYCTCKSGYTLGTDRASCIDIDECARNTSNCTQTCSNSVGGYTCGCLTGYSLKEDNISCSDINECADNNGGCQHVCNNTIGSFTCRCHPGFTKRGSACIALSCPLLTSPLHGRISCTGLQVTNENCTLSCDPGYNLIGSSLRTCLGSNQSWSGEDVTCRKSQCPVLTSTESTLVLYPCGNIYQDSCRLVCEMGYSSNGHFSWSQTCNVTNGSYVNWDSDRICRVRDMCDPNPCSPGQCTVSSSNDIQCNCKGTYTTGKRCDMGQIIIESIPVLTEGDTHSTHMTSRLSSPITILATSSNNDSLAISQPLISLQSRATLTVHAKQPGLFTVNYNLNPGAPAIKPDDSLYLVTSNSRSRRNTDDYFTLQGQERGHLGIGCCQKHLAPTPYKCSSSLTLHSYCQWTNSSSTKGVTHLSVHTLYLPLSIAGLQVTNNDGDMMMNINNDDEATQTCVSCDKGPRDVRCQVSNPSLHFDTKIIHGIVKEKSLITSFLDSVKKFLPSWLKIQVYTLTPTQSFSKYDFLSFIGTYKELKSKAGCEDIANIQDTPSMIYAMRTTSRLLFTVDSHPVFLYPSTNSPFCVAIDICSHHTPRLHSSIPLSLVSRQNLNSMTTIRPLLMDDRAQFKFNSIMLQEDGIIIPLASDAMDEYWNGSDYFIPSLPRYQYGMDITLQRTFTSEGDLMVELDYQGSVYYQPNTTNGEVPGLLMGNLTLNITTTINGKTGSLMMISVDNKPALFSYPTGSSTESPLSLGISAALQYASDSSGMFYRKHFVSPGSSCLVFVFVSMDDTLTVNNVSFTSDCLGVKLGQLNLSNKLRTIVTLPGDNNNRNGAIFKATLLSSTPSQLGNFYLNPPDSSSQYVVNVNFRSRERKMSGVLYATKVALFDALFTNNVTIDDYRLSYQANTRIYSSYEVRVMSSFSSLNGSTFVEGIFLDQPNSFRSGMSAYLEEHLHSEIRDALIRSNRTMESIRISKNWRDKLYNQLTSAQEQLSQAENLISVANNSYNTRKSESKVTLQELSKVLSQFIQYNNTLPLNVLLCGNSQCDSMCKSGVSCTSYIKPLTLSVAGSCNYTALVNQTISQVDRVSYREWQYMTQCESCWKVTWYKSLYLSEQDCCKVVKSPIDTYRYSIRHINTTVNDTQKRLCMIDNRTETVSSHKCQMTPCLYQITNDTCLNITTKCYRQFARNFEAINSTISRLYSLYLERILAEEEAKLNLTRVTINVSRLKENVHLLQDAYDNANTSYYINIKSNQSLLEEAALYAPFTGFFNSPNLPPRLINVLQITNVSFHIEFTSTTPVTLPVAISYIISANGVTQTIQMNINFLQPRQYIFRHISNKILESYLSVVRSTRNKRDMSTPTVSETRNHRFHDTCIEIGTLKRYTQQILTLLNESMSVYTDSINIVNNSVSYNDSSNYGIMNESLVSQYRSLMSELTSKYSNVMSLLKNNSFAFWQAHLEIVHVMVSHAETFGCSSFLDCLGTAANLYEQILEDTPNSYQSLVDLRNLKESLYQVGYNKSLTFEEAHNILIKFYNLLILSNVARYWCIEPPVIIQHPSPTVSVQVNSSLTLSCQASSTSWSSLIYFWTKDNIIIVGSNSSTYTLQKVQLRDQGDYRCVIVNDAGSSTSLPSVVTVTFKPLLNITLQQSMNAYAGDSNGIDLTCDAIGSPVPGWKWFYRQTQSDVWHQIITANLNILTLRNPQLKDRGWYTCMAYNNIGNASSNPIFLNILSTTGSKVKYTFTLTLKGMRETWAHSLVNSLLTQANVSSILSSGGTSLTSLGINDMSSLLFSIQVAIVDYNPSINLNTLATHMSSNVSQLERDKDSLNTLLRQSNNQLQFPLESSMQTVSIISHTIGARIFECPAGYQINADHILCVACPPGSYNDGSSFVSSFVNSGSGDYIQELTPQCNKCPLGTYQENGGRSSCVTCSNGYTTSDIGSTTQSSCQKMCSSHTYSSTGFEPCTECPPMHYQLYKGQTSCVPCQNTTAKIELCSRPEPSSSSTISSSSVSSSSFSSSSVIKTTKVEVTSTVIERTSRSPLPSAIGEAVSSSFFSTTTIAIIGGAVVLIILIGIVCIVIVGLRVKKKKLHQQELRTIRLDNPEVELNSYEGRNFDSKESEAYDDIKSKKELGDMAAYNTVSPINDPIYESLDDMDEQRNTLWGPPPSLPPANTTNPLWLSNSSGPMSPPILITADDPITDEYISMSSPSHLVDGTVNYQNVQ